MKISIAPTAVSTFCSSITPLIINRTPKNPNITGSMCVNINSPDAILSLVLFLYIISYHSLLFLVFNIFFYLLNYYKNITIVIY